MPRDQRASSFLFEPGRYRNDPAVLAMSDAARGCYSMLWCAGWEMPEVGVYPADDRVLAQLAMTSPEAWAAVRDQVAPAFDTTTRPGWWVQKGLVRTHDAQDRFVASQSRRGMAGAKARWDKEKDASALPTHPDADASAIAYLGSRVRFSGSENLPHPAAAAPAHARGAPTTAGGSRKRSQAEPDRTLPPEYVAATGARFGLSAEVASLLAERLLLEFDARGYRSARSAFLTWCRRERDNPPPADANGHGGLSWRPRSWYGEPEDRPTPGWTAPGPLSWSSGGHLGVELPTPERWRGLTADELAGWQKHLRGKA